MSGTRMVDIIDQAGTAGVAEMEQPKTNRPGMMIVVYDVTERDKSFLSYHNNYVPCDLGGKVEIDFENNVWRFKPENGVPEERWYQIGVEARKLSRTDSPCPVFVYPLRGRLEQDELGEEIQKKLKSGEFFG